MRRQIVWIGFWTTLALWLGSIAGCTTSSLEVLSDSESQEGEAAAVAAAEVDAEVEPEQPLAATSVVEEKPVAPKVVKWSDQTARANPTSPVDIATMRGAQAAAGEAGIDRSLWPKIVVRSVDGVADRHTYFKDCATHRFEPGVTGSMNPLQQLDVALMNSQAANWSRENVKGLVTQPLRFVGDLICLPVNLVVESGKKAAGEP